MHVSSDKPSKWQALEQRSTAVAHVTLPRHMGRIRFFSERGKRTARCVACDHPIPAKSMRFVVYTLHERAVKFPRGGRSNISLCYMHPVCIRVIIKGSAIDRRDSQQCVDCGRPLKELMHRACSSLRGEWGWICHQCLDSGRFTLCAVCRIYVPKRLCSTSVEKRSIDPFADEDEGIESGSSVCDGCSEGYGVPTLHSIMRREKADTRFSGYLRRAIEDVNSWLGEHNAERPSAAGEHQRQD